LKRWWVPWLVLAAVVVIAGLVLAARSGPSNAPAARAARLDNQLACPVCVGESVADSNAPESRAIRSDIVKRIRAGQRDADIRDAYVAIYGEHILLTPSNGGIGIVAWGIPIVALVLGGAGIVFTVRRRWQRVSTLDRDELESERDFLLRSIDDLDEEHAAGNVDDGTYHELHDDYTARAAAVIRSLDTGTDLTAPEPTQISALRRALTVGGIVVLALVVAVLLSRAVGQRRPGQTITGNAQVGSGSTTTGGDSGPALAAAVKRQPQSYAAHIAYARYLIQNGGFADAVREFGAAARLDPSQPEPPTYAGWAGALVSRQVGDARTRQSLLSASLERINAVIKAHPRYPDAYALRGVILFNFEQNARDAIPSFQQYLLLTDETNPLRAQVLAVLAEAEKAEKAANVVAPN
jgi:cytochrome c-type biogenesis protein CcmH